MSLESSGGGSEGAIGAILVKLQDLELEQQQQVLEFAEWLAQRHKTSLNEQPKKFIWEKISEITAQVPDEVWERIPTDGAVQHDHYLYGTPKKSL
jgi:hypothetical protein